MIFVIGILGVFIIVLLLVAIAVTQAGQYQKDV